MKGEREFTCALQTKAFELQTIKFHPLSPAPFSPFHRERFPRRSLFPVDKDSILATIGIGQIKSK